MEFSTPIWNSLRLSHVVNVLECPDTFYLSSVSTGETLQPPDKNEMRLYDARKKVLEAFYKHYSEWFPRGMRLSTLLTITKDQWNYDPSTLPEIPTAGGAATPRRLTSWRPTTLYIRDMACSLEWSLHSSGWMEAKTPTAVVATTTDITPVLEEVDLDETVPSDTEADQEIPIHVASRAAARQRIRLARLRASIAELRARKLAEAYYLRYDGTDSDSSELTEDSDDHDASDTQ